MDYRATEITDAFRLTQALAGGLARFDAIGVGAPL